MYNEMKEMFVRRMANYIREAKRNAEEYKKTNDAFYEKSERDCNILFNENKDIASKIFGGEIAFEIQIEARKRATEYPEYDIEA